MSGGWRTATCVLGSSLVLYAAAGCGCLPGTGGLFDISSAIAKLQAGDIGGLSAAEIIALSKGAALSGFALPEITSAQAAAAVRFLDDYGLETIQDLENLDWSKVVVPEELLDLIEYFTGERPSSGNST